MDIEYILKASCQFGISNLMDHLSEKSMYIIAILTSDYEDYMWSYAIDFVETWNLYMSINIDKMFDIFQRPLIWLKIVNWN